MFCPQGSTFLLEAIDALCHQNIGFAEAVGVRNDAHNVEADSKPKLKRMQSTAFYRPQLIQYPWVEIDSSKCSAAVFVVSAQSDSVAAALCHLLFKIGDQPSP